MRHNGLVLRVRNVEQKILWENELSGQISDGMWENARPNDHWEDWCSAQVVVDPDHPGRNWTPRRASYNFSSKDLLEVVGERMLGYVRVATGNGAYSMADMRKDLRDLQQIIKQWVPSDTPIPPQPEGREVATMAGGYPERITVYRSSPVDDPQAVEMLAERELESKHYRLERLEKKYAEARATADKLGVELEELKAELGLLV